MFLQKEIQIKCFKSEYNVETIPEMGEGVIKEGGDRRGEFKCDIFDIL
jgi:hypothetical protein